jgi:hypothetical protein
MAFRFRDRRSLLLASILGSALLVLGCDDEAACDPEGELPTVVEIMQSFYLFNDESAQRAKYRGINVGAYSSFEHLLRFLRWGPDAANGWSYVTTVAQDQAFLEGGPFTTFGFLYDYDALGDPSMTVQLVFANGPAAEAGIMRGDAILAINGADVRDLGTVARISEALGHAEPGISRTLTVQAPEEEPVDIRLRTAALPLPAVSPRPPSFSTPVILSSSVGDVGYVPFILFIETAVPQLDQMFAAFKTAEIKNIVVDLRYSPGGLVWVGGHFGSLLAGPSNAGEVQRIVRFNSELSENDFVENFAFLANSIDFDRIVFITTGESASAAESLINELDSPFTDIEIGVVGAPSHGKAAGQSAFDFCAETLRFRLITFEILNANDDGRYYDGLDVDCDAADDLSKQLGDPEEESLAAALHWIETGGGCLTDLDAFETPAGVRDRQPKPERMEPWLRPMNLR